MTILAADWYDLKPDLSSFFQGDIVRDVPVIFLPDKISKWLILRPNLKGKVHTDEVLGGQICKWFESRPEGQLLDRWQYGNREEYVAAKAQMMSVAILTQSCDIENRQYYQIAPLYPETTQKPASLEHLRANRLNYTFYLPALVPYIPENSYIDLAQTSLVPKTYFPKNAVPDRLAARLTDLARTRLQEQIAHYFGRPFGFGVRDKAGTTAEYACVACFYRTGSSVKRGFQSGNNFEPCEHCGDTRWILLAVPGQDS